MTTLRKLSTILAFSLGILAIALPTTVYAQYEEVYAPDCGGTGCSTAFKHNRPAGYRGVTVVFSCDGGAQPVTKLFCSPNKGFAHCGSTRVVDGTKGACNCDYHTNFPEGKQAAVGYGFCCGDQQGRCY